MYFNMAEFIHFEADASDESNDEGEPMDVDNSLIDDSMVHENNEPSFFRFYNQTRDVEEVFNDDEEEEELLEANNYLDECEIADIKNESYDKFEKFEVKRNLFLRGLLNPTEEQTKENSFYLTLLYAIRFNKTKKSDLCEESEIEDQIGNDLYSKIIGKKDKCILDQNKRNFDNMCFDINEILVENKLFLRVYELKDKFRYLFHEDYKKRVLRSLSSCIKEKFNGFTFANIKLAKKEKTDLCPINIIYEPVKKLDQVIK